MSVDAGEIGRAVVVGGTLGALAQYFRVAEVTAVALARGPVVVTTTLGVDGAPVVKDAGAHALVVVAGIRVWTVRVRFTFN